METIKACSIWRTLELTGDIPVKLIIERLFLGTRRFDEFVALTGLPRSVVNVRLKRLVDAGFLAKRARPGKLRQHYHLTTMGRDYFKAALMILRWQHRWEPTRREFQVVLTHKDCGRVSEPVPVCAQCKVEIDAREVTWAPGPGLSDVVPVYERRRRQTEATSGRRKTQALVDSVIELFGDRWATLVVRACFTGIHRFTDIQRDTLMATNVLSDRIERLLGQGIIRAVPYSSHTERFEYRLTVKGRDIYPVLVAMLEWGDAWFADDQGPPLLLTHTPCGHPLELEIVCDGCRDPIGIRNTGFTIGPGKDEQDAAA